MLTLKKVAVTGGLASGKSAACQILKACGAYVVSADEIVHELLASESEISKRVVSLLGSEILKDNKIDRKKIAQKVFSKPELLEQLEKILHPAVLDEIAKRYQKVESQQSHALFVAEVPLLYESESHKFFDYVVAIITDDDTARARYEKAGHPQREYDLRMKRQFTPHEKAADADFVVMNNGTLDELKRQVLPLYQACL